MYNLYDALCTISLVIEIISGKDFNKTKISHKVDKRTVSVTIDNFNPDDYYPKPTVDCTYNKDTSFTGKNMTFTATFNSMTTSEIMELNIICAVRQNLEKFTVENLPSPYKFNKAHFVTFKEKGSPKTIIFGSSAAGGVLVLIVLSVIIVSLVKKRRNTSNKTQPTNRRTNQNSSDRQPTNERARNRSNESNLQLLDLSNVAGTSSFSNANATTSSSTTLPKRTNPPALPVPQQQVIESESEEEDQEEAISSDNESLAQVETELELMERRMGMTHSEWMQIPISIYVDMPAVADWTGYQTPPPHIYSDVTGFMGNNEENCPFDMEDAYDS